MVETTPQPSHNGKKQLTVEEWRLVKHSAAQQEEEDED
jgi:hypothetical protein